MLKPLKDYRLALVVNGFVHVVTDKTKAKVIILGEFEELRVVKGS